MQSFCRIFLTALSFVTIFTFDDSGLLYRVTWHETIFRLMALYCGGEYGLKMCNGASPGALEGCSEGRQHPGEGGRAAHLGGARRARAMLLHQQRHPRVLLHRRRRSQLCSHLQKLKENIFVSFKKNNTKNYDSKERD